MLRLSQGIAAALVPAYDEDRNEALHVVLSGEFQATISLRGDNVLSELLTVLESDVKNGHEHSIECRDETGVSWLNLRRVHGAWEVLLNGHGFGASFALTNRQTNDLVKSIKDAFADPNRVS